ncbi:tol-pal system YbgF family protein [Streptomyces sp. NPDC053048]|uniref:tol-pal system YbgF family protein n=1 Tax=Streptomyces sp. NPDC053048 TaxID=3365694 RepID=UPI0037D319EE
MRDKPFRHPLAALRHELDLTAEEYLDRLSPVHAALGYGHLSTRREKVTRWESGIHAPETVTQYAMAAFHNVPREAVDDMGWPHWLLIAFPDDRPILDSPWTPMGTVRSVAAAARGGSVDRRGFLIASGTTLTAVTAGWTDALSTTHAVAATRGRRRLTADTITRLEQRLDDLRRLDDVLGGGELRPAAAAEFQLLSALANDATYTEDVGRRLLAALAEASRMCGWLHFDAGRHAGAQSFYITALRASATAGDRATGANILAFMAIQTYSTGNPQDAVNLVRTAQEQAAGHSTPRVRAMLHARAARALSKTGDRKACARELDAARDAYAHGTHDDDPPWSYWLDAGEIEMLSGSSALDLGDPRTALHYFEAAYKAAYATDGYVRDHALYLTRAAQAHLDLGDLDAACATATKALTQTDGVDSSRPSDALDGIRSQLMPHRHVRAVRQFLSLSA